MGQADQKDKAEAETKALERAVCATTAELHLHQYPAFNLTPRKATDNTITFSETIREGGVVLKREWTVHVLPAYGWPGEHEAEVWRAIEHIVHLKRVQGTLSNPIVTSYSEIRRHMSGKGMSGSHVKRIDRSLSCLHGTSVKSSFFYYSDGQHKKSYQFSLISSISAEKKRLSNGKEVVDKVLIELPDEIFKNIQNRYIRPLDKGFRDQLDKWISKRLYELLGIKFYALQKKREPYRTRYSRLCALVGIARQQYLSRARQVLGRAHSELEKKGFLWKVEWFPIRGAEHDWVLCYWPGPRARAEWKKDYWKEVRLSEVLVVEDLPTEGEPAWIDELSPDEAPITIDVVSDRVEQPYLPFDAPEADTATAAGGAAAQALPPTAEAETEPRHLLVTPSERGKEAKPGERAEFGEALDAYTQAAIEAFERGVGSHRRLARLSAAEKKRLGEWRVLGVVASDIEEGAREAQAELAAERKAQGDGKGRARVLSMAYIHGHVRDAKEQRERAERRLGRAVARAREVQDPKLLAAESALKKQLRSRLPPEVYEELFARVLLVRMGPDYALLLTEQEKAAEEIRPHRALLRELLKIEDVYEEWVLDWAQRS